MSEAAGKDKLWRVIRVLTTAPLIAVYALLCLWLFRRESFSGAGQFVYELLCLGLLPLMAYPTQRFLPRFRDRGREGQRSLAMLYAFGGYVLCALLHLICGASAAQWFVCLEYLCCGVVMLLFNRVFHKKISGHACGVAGPMLILANAGLRWATPIGLIVLWLTAVASLRSQRHTLPEYVGGTMAAVAVDLILMLWL